MPRIIFHTAKLCDLHVYQVPLDLWRTPLNNILNQSVTDTISLGIIRVPPDLSLVDIRTEIRRQLEDLAPKYYVFLRSVGRSITRLKERQEYQLKAKHFLPPVHYAPELYILEATPEVREALGLGDRSVGQSPNSIPRGSPGGRSYRDGHRYRDRHEYGDRSSSPRSLSPIRKGAMVKGYRGANGYEREAAYTNNTNEDSGVAGMSPEDQYKLRDKDNYYDGVHSKNQRERDRYATDDEDEERRRNQDERTGRDGWANDQDERRRRAEEDEQRREEDRKRRKEEEEELRRRQEGQRLDNERRRQEEENRRRREEEEERRRREEEEERRRRGEEEERRRREEEEERRRREEEEERRRGERREDGERTKGESDDELNRFPSPPPLRMSPEPEEERNTESAKLQRKEEQKKLLAELDKARSIRQNTEKEREELVKKAKTLQSKTQNRRNQARDVWKKRYFEEKKRTPALEEQTNRLKEELDAIHRRMMAVLEGPKDKNVKMGEARPSQQNNYIIQCTRFQHDIDDLKRRVENAKMKLTAEMKLRTQAEAELRAVRAEAIQKKINMRGQPFQVY